ncbi:MAG: AbrB/MazE/SpoVT family DNA-binding domain-containing protein [Euryarchaeota archaeon]|nr:AbrB/MazE/SpoVT family DNA-binding domain-containing protein [Euryarchaeota archaeon]
MRCPICEKGSLRKGEVEEEMFGISLGRFPAEICDACGESFLDGQAMEEIEKKAKELGVWGLAEKLKVVKSGNSLVVRIPAKIAKFLGIEAGNEILLYPEGKKKAVFEIT